MDVKKLEELLQGNRIDLRMLNKQQKIFIDELQKSGKIDTRPLDLMEAEQNHAAEKVAKEKERFADPIRDMTADFLNRDKVAMYTDIGVLMAQMLWDRKRLAGAILKPQNPKTPKPRKNGIYKNIKRINTKIKNNHHYF